MPAAIEGMEDKKFVCVCTKCLHRKRKRLTNSTLLAAGAAGSQNHGGMGTLCLPPAGIKPIGKRKATNLCITKCHFVIHRLVFLWF